MAAPYDPTLIMDLRGLFPYSDGGTRRARDFSGFGHSPAETNFAGDDSEYVDLPLGQGAYFSAANKVYTLTNDSHFDFTFQNFSIEIWAQPNAAGLARGLAIRGLLNTDGWEFNLTAANLLQFSTYQAAAAQLTNSTAVATANGRVQQYIAIRDGATVRLYIDGREVTYNAVGVHINPTTSVRDMLIWGLVGYGQRARVFTRVLSASEIWNRFVNAMRV